jgi:alpha-L-arabinofuranosidase
LLFITTAVAAAAADQITVDVSRTIRHTSHHPIGINVNYLQDDDNNRTAVRSTTAALQDMGVKFLRYPGGEKSDGYLWSIPPYSRSVPTLARTGPAEWPSHDPGLVRSDGKTFRIDPLDFDEFMTMCQAIACEPVVVVAYDSMHKPAGAGGVAPTRQQLIETAREWVRYANITKRYQVKYWEIGNESYHSGSYNGKTTAEVYADDLIEFSRAMKTIDPTILIGAGGDSTQWWSTVLGKASGSIDFLSVHTYPIYGWGGYETYRQNNADLTYSAGVAVSAIRNYAPVRDRSRLRVAVTELNVIDWAANTAWANRNDQGHALALVDMIGQHLKMPELDFVQLWNTRWVLNNYEDPPSLYDALSRSGEYLPIGRAMAIWGQHLLEQMVATTDTQMVRSFASYSPDGSRVNVILINKDTSPRSVSVNFAGLGPISSATRRVLRGAGPQELSPVWGDTVENSFSANRVNIAMDPVSITVLSVASKNLAPSTVSVSPNVGNGSTASLTLTYSDPNGAADLVSVYGLISTAVDSRNACYVIYYPASKYLYLISDNGQAAHGPIHPGSTGTVQNSQCGLAGNGLSVSEAGSNLTLSLALTFTNSFTGAKNIYMTARDTAGAWATWMSRGTWTPNLGNNRLPDVPSVVPNAGVGSAQTFSLSYSDPDGFMDLSAVYALIHTAADSRNACYAIYLPPYNFLYLVSDNGGSVLGPVSLGTGTSPLQNSQCTVDTTTSSALGAGTALTLKLSLSFKPAFAGNKDIFMAAQDKVGTWAELTSRGTWIVP